LILGPRAHIYAESAHRQTNGSERVSTYTYTSGTYILLHSASAPGSGVSVGRGFGRHDHESTTRLQFSPHSLYLTTRNRSHAIAMCTTTPLLSIRANRRRSFINIRVVVGRRRDCYRPAQVRPQLNSTNKDPRSETGEHFRFVTTPRRDGDCVPGRVQIPSRL
jgi:hypothetical protein